jgi:maltose alpha-D-glucosyltransferase / alpha-amylase
MLASDPLWYKDAIIYELHVRSFFDSIGDGMGDFGGLAQKLDYLQDLGVTAIWLLPFYPSPLKDDGYDIADYTDVHPQYGKLDDFKTFLNEAHTRGLRVVTELVINHTSDRHPWFQRARRSPPGSPERNYYVWSDTPEKYRDARIIFKDFEQSNWSWDPVAKAYYWHRFYGHQPDLNYDNPAVWDAIFPILAYWLDMGVDGMRLDAVPYLFEREGTSCENLAETHTFLKALRQRVDERFPNRMLLAEANQWPEDAVAYFGSGDECHMAFHFPLMPRMFMAIHMEDRFPIMDILAQTPTIPDNCQWCLFLRNHDELTLEMVTDEERDYMYRAYAGDARARINLGIRHRLAPLLGNSRRRIELMNGLLLSLPGTPVIYYGDEIGMGDNIYLGDRNGVRTPMQWSADRNAGFSRANPQKLFLPVIIDPEYHYEAINVEAQQNNPNSLLWWMKRLISLRKRYKAFSRGALEFLQPANRKVLAFMRHYQDEHLLIVANLSRFVQHVELDLSKLQGAVPVELFGRNALPAIGKPLYPLTLGPHAFYWFLLEQKPVPVAGEHGVPAQADVPVLTARTGWEEFFQVPAREHLERALTRYVQQCRWAGGHLRQVKSVVVAGAFRLLYGDTRAFVSLIDVDYVEGRAETFVLPLTLVQGEKADQLREQSQAMVVAKVQGALDGMIVDALQDSAFREAILLAMTAGKKYSMRDGQVSTSVIGSLESAGILADSCPPSRLVQEEQTNTSIVYGDRLVLKLFRRVLPGIHPENEMGRYLTQRAAFANAAQVLGSIEYQRRKLEPVTLAVLHRFVPNEGTAWQYTLDELSRYFERVLALPPTEPQLPPGPDSLIELANTPVPAAAEELIGRYLESARLLGQRTAELHLALGQPNDDPAFSPEPFSQLYQRSIYQSMRNVHQFALYQLARQLDSLPEKTRSDGQRIVDSGTAILDRFRVLLSQRISGQRIRCHGNYNLGEVLFTGKDFVIIDFEGDPSRSLSDRQVKRSPLRDVADLIRSLHYAAYSPLLGENNARGRVPGLIRVEDVSALEPWARTWYQWVAAAFLKAYLATAQQAAFLPGSAAEVRLLLDVFLLDKSLHELRHELTSRPHWVGIPLRGLLQMLGQS